MLTGYAASEALGRSPRFLQGKKTNRLVLKEIHEALAKAQPIRREVINYRKDGAEYWMDIDVVPILNSAGKCTHFAAIERDITESKRLRESLKLFRALMDRSPDAIEVIDPETGRFLDFNETSCRRLGYTREEMLNLSIPDVLDTGGVPFSMQANAGSAAGDQGVLSRQFLSVIIALRQGKIGLGDFRLPPSKHWPVNLLRNS